MSGARGGRCRAFGGYALAALFALAACGELATNSNWPADAVLVVGDAPITRAEFERVSGWVAEVVPAEVERAQQRRALKAILIPRAAVQSIYKRRHDEQLVRAMQELERLLAGGTPSETGSDDGHRTPLQVLLGNWIELELPLWGAARDSLKGAVSVDGPGASTGPGPWFGPVEGTGWIALARVLHLERGRQPDEDLLEIELIYFPYSPATFSTGTLDGALDKAEITIIDEEVGELIPLYLEHRMNAQSMPKTANDG